MKQEPKARKVKTNPNYERIVNVDLEIHKDATAQEWQRYDAILPIISVALLNGNVGKWAGRETSLGTPEDGFVRTNYWYVLESGAEIAKEEIESIIENFNLQSFTRLKIGSPQETSTDYAKKFVKEYKLTWTWYKDK